MRCSPTPRCWRATSAWPTWRTSRKPKPRSSAPDVDVSPVEDRHLDAMAELLQSMYADHAPLGARHRFANGAVARAAIARTPGYLLAPPTGYLGIAHLAARPTDARRVYR